MAKKPENKKVTDSNQKVSKGSKKSEKHYLIDDLDPKWQRAVLMRLEGADHQYIAKELDYKYGYVRTLFFTGEPCKKAFDELEAEIKLENRKRFEKLQQEMEDAAPEAFAHLRRFAKRNWKAAESLLHISGFSPVQKVKAEVENKDLEKMTESLDKLSEYARRTTTASDKGTTQ